MDTVLGKRIVSVRSLKNQAVIADQCFVAMRFFDRLRGLIGKRALGPGEAMLFPSCNDIHMWFMSIPIDVVFLRKVGEDSGTLRFEVRSVRERVKPWRVLPLRDGKASETLELASGSVQRFEIREGDVLCIG